ncbi:C40 family peptidase [Glycomyces harbinensis]|uniref:NlpC/P60 family protein n=1 Tax=Glycomyces harbinensis TaxID=58114 RepID=A0A1G7CK84_9ACTN|nr:C40 family peptidase [Glycomyces harbinensis]SDE39653.1 NlpC/P60 family protein [Glycomyces harbinensis]
MRVSRFGARVIAAASAAAVMVVVGQSGGALPAQAEPGVTVPDDGERPAGGATDDTPVTNPETADGPLGDQITAAQIDLAQIAEETTAAESEWLAREDRLAGAQTAWTETAADLETAQAALDYAAGEAYTELSGVPEADLPDLSGLTPLGGEWDLPSLSADFDDAETAEAVARAALDAASLSADRAEGRYITLDAEFDRAQTELNELVEENREELEQLEREREAAAAEYSGDFSSEVDGWDAAPEAKKAVEYALAQLGDPYVWGAEGPDSFDCSGLVQSAYAYAGVSLPRVAADQYNATRDKPVDTEKLLPGDLLYWWDDPGSWQSVYHTGMYLGDGKMIQAPRTGDVVKISSIWFENFAGAHRVVDAVQTDPDAENPTQSPSDPGTTDPEPTPSETGSPSPSPSPTPSEEPSPTETPSSTPSPTDGEDTPTDDGGESPTPSADSAESATLTRESEA